MAIENKFLIYIYWKKFYDIQILSNHLQTPWYKCQIFLLIKNFDS